MSEKGPLALPRLRAAPPLSARPNHGKMKRIPCTCKCIMCRMALSTRTSLPHACTVLRSTSCAGSRFSLCSSIACLCLSHSAHLFAQVCAAIHDSLSPSPPTPALHTFASISHTLSAVRLLLAPCFTSTIPLPNRTSSDVHTPPTNQVPPPPSPHILPLHVASVLS